MKKPQRVALVGAGKFTDSPLSCFRNLADNLGPVKAPSIRVASRISNILRAGRPVADFAEFEPCTLVLVSVPGPLLRETVTEMAASELNWKRKAVVVCSSDEGCDRLRALEDRGAMVGSLSFISGPEERWFLIEAQREVERAIRKLLGEGARSTVICPLGKSTYLRAMTCLSTRFTPLLQEAAECLKTAGLPGAQAGVLMERRGLRTIRSFLRSGKAK